MTKEIIVEYYPFTEASANYMADEDVMNAFLCAERNYVHEAASHGKAITLSELLKRLDISTGNVANNLFVKNIIWFNCYEGVFVGAILERSP